MIDPDRPAVLFVGFTLLAWAVVSASGVAPIAGFQQDTETAEASFSSANDLTVEVRSVQLSPSTVTVNGSETVTAELAAPAADDVNTSEFTLTFVSGDRTVSVSAADVTCDDRCTLTVSEQTIASLGDGPGEYALVVSGWWTYDRRFVGRVPVTVENNPGQGHSVATPGTNVSSDETETIVPGTETSDTTVTTARTTGTPTPSSGNSTS